MVENIKGHLATTLGTVLELVDQLVLSGPLRPSSDVRWARLREFHARGMKLVDDFANEKPSPLPEYPAPWEDLDIKQFQWGIFQAEGLTPSPHGMFPTEEEADAYLEHMTTLPNENDRWPKYDWCVMPCVIIGITHNSYEKPTEDYREAARLLWKHIMHEALK